MSKSRLMTVGLTLVVLAVLNRVPQVRAVINGG